MYVHDVGSRLGDQASRAQSRLSSPPGDGARRPGRAGGPCDARDHPWIALPRGRGRRRTTELRRESDLDTAARWQEVRGESLAWRSSHLDSESLVPLDAKTGVYWEARGEGEPLLLFFPFMASHAEIFGEVAGAIKESLLECLTDRYKVLMVDYPSIGRSGVIAPAELTADRVCDDLLAVTDAAGFDRFAFWGYSWGCAAGLQLAARTSRLTAFIGGGWPPLGGPYAEILQACLRKVDNPPPEVMAVLREPAQYAQWISFYRSVLELDEGAVLRRIRCPRLIFAGELGDVVEAGVSIPIASTIRSRRAELEELGWRVAEVSGRGHEVGMEPDVVGPLIRAFLNEALSASVATGAKISGSRSQ